MKRLSSKDNPLIKKIIRLRERPEKFIPKPGRPEAEVLVEGPRFVQTALEAGINFSTVAVSEKFISEQRWAPILDSLLRKETPVVVIEEKLVKHISETTSPQGIVGIARCRINSLEDLSDTHVLVVADGIQDPGNLGSLLRCADATGMNCVVVLKGSANPFHPKVIRASAGSIFNLRITIVDRGDFAGFIKNRGFNLIYTSQTAEKDVFSWKPKPPLAVVFGSEAHGVSEEIKRISHDSIRIPIYGRAESLNVTAASAVVLYQIARGLRVD